MREKQIEILQLCHYDKYMRTALICLNDEEIQELRVSVVGVQNYRCPWQPQKKYIQVKSLFLVICWKYFCVS